MSFDVLRDSLGEERSDYPMTAYLVAGTQAEKKRQNLVMFFKMSQLNQTQHEEDEGGRVHWNYFVLSSVKI